jgi:nucleoside-diphosphate-sugar epimerase
VTHLVTLPWVETVYCLDIKPMTDPPFDSPKAKPVVADLGDAHDKRWYEAVESADGIVHFAVRNPAPTGDWDDAVIAVDMTASLLARAKPSGCRFLYASSNHAMGQYKDHDWQGLKLNSSTPPLPGTAMYTPNGYRAPNMYGGSKLIGERLVRAWAIASGGRHTGVALRIGWGLPGDNGPDWITLGNNKATQPPGEYARDLTWFRNMWLSRRDLVGEFTAALTADASRWPEPGIVVNAVSGNRGMLWDMDEARNWLGYVPVDDVWTTLGIEPPQP